MERQNDLNPYRAFLGFIAATALSFSMSCTPGGGPAVVRGPHVVVLGFDGMDPGLAKAWMAAGKLPHLEQIAHDGVFLPLSTPPPVESPVAWASFATGLNPGKQGFFDFVDRSTDTLRA